MKKQEKNKNNERIGMKRRENTIIIRRKKK